MKSEESANAGDELDVKHQESRIMTLEDYLRQDAEQWPDKVAVVCGDEQVTYAELNRRVDERVGQLTNDEGQIVCLRATCGIGYLVDYFALHRRGCVVAPLEHNIPEAVFDRIATELGRYGCPQGTADVLYTTGTTGRSKGVMISHRTIIADAENLIDGQGFRHDTVFVINGPLNHIGSLSKLYPVILLGGTIVLVDGLKDLDRFFSAFDSSQLPPDARRLRVFATFLVPASIRMLVKLSRSRMAALADCLDFVETGAAAISQADMEALCNLLPQTRLYNTYASTETGIIATQNFNPHSDPDALCQAGCLGRPMRHSQIVITPEGNICCQGATLMTGYVGDPERTATVLRHDTIFTSDLGVLDEQGRLHLRGREDDVINVGGFKVAPTEVEDVALSHPSVVDCICIGVPHPITGTALKLLVQLADGQALDRRSLAMHLRQHLETFKVPMLYEQVATVHRTFNGKLDRKAYR